MAKPKSKWLGPKRRAAGEGSAQRHSTKATVEHARQVPDKRGVKRVEVDSPTEAAYVGRISRRTEGWVHGARVANHTRGNR